MPFSTALHRGFFFILMVPTGEPTRYPPRLSDWPFSGDLAKHRRESLDSTAPRPLEPVAAGGDLKGSEVIGKIFADRDVVRGV